MTIKLIPAELYKLEKVTDDPRYEGFALQRQPSVLGRENIEEDMVPGFEVTATNRKWKAAHLSGLWKAPKVLGTVHSYNDFPSIDMVLPAFSRRACEALRDFLEPNGELLPLQSSAGEYYFYNITTIVDALDLKRSKCDFWCDPPTTAVNIEYFAFDIDKLAGHSIFRIIESPMMTIVTDQFVDRVEKQGLNGFNFIKIWPYPQGVYWRDAAKQSAKRHSRDLKEHTAVIILTLAASKPSAGEKDQIKHLEDELNKHLATPSLDSAYFGSYEGHDLVDDEYRMFISCPDADDLVQKLTPWFRKISWKRGFRVMKKYGGMYDFDAKSELVNL